MARKWWIENGNLAFASQAEADAYVTANPGLVYDGLMATIDGSAVVWADGVWAATGGGNNQINAYPGLEKIFTGSSKNIVAIWGSSTMSYSTIDTSAMTMYNNTLLFNAFALNRWPVNIAYNGAQPGTGAATIATKFLAEILLYSYDIAILQFGANDLASGNTAASVISSAMPCILAAMRSNKKVILVVPYRINPISYGHTEYRAYSNWCASMTVRFPGCVYAVDLYKQVGYGVETPTSWLDVSGVHVNFVGSVAMAPAWAPAFDSLFGQYDAEIDSVGCGSCLFPTYAPPAGWDMSNATESVGQTDSMGRTSRRLTSVSSSQSYVSKTVATGVVLGESYRVFADIIVGAGNTIPIGVYFKATDGTVGLKCGSISRSSPEAHAPGTRLRIMTQTLIANAGMVSSMVAGVGFGGSAGAYVDVVSLGAFRISQ